MDVATVGLVITDLEPGGAERAATELALRIDQSRFRPVVFSLASRPPAGLDACAIRLEAASIETHYLGASRAPHFPRTLFRLGRLFRRIRPRIVQSFLFHANLLSRLGAARLKNCVVLSGIRVAERGASWHRWLDLCTHRLVTKHVCVSDDVRRFSETTIGLPADRLVVIRNGIDINCYRNVARTDLASLGIEADRQIVVFVGRLERQKGVDWLIETAPEWLTRLPKVDLLLVGEGSLAGWIRRQAARLRIENRVHMAGWRPDVPGILARSQLLVLPSRWEGMPNVILEAMASRLPVLATDAEGIDEMLGEGADEQTVAFGDTSGWAEKLVDLLSDEPRRRALGVRNHRQAAGYSLDAMAGAYQELWTGLLSPSSRPL